MNILDYFKRKPKTGDALIFTDSSDNILSTAVIPFYGKDGADDQVMKVIDSFRETHHPENVFVQRYYLDDTDPYINLSDDELITKLSGVRKDPKIYLPEVIFYFKSNEVYLPSRISTYTAEHYNDYLKDLNHSGIKDTDRPLHFMEKVLKNDPRPFPFLPDSQKTYRICYTACSENTDNIQHLPLHLSASDMKKIISDCIPFRHPEFNYRQETNYPAEIVQNLQKLPPSHLEKVAPLFDKELNSYVQLVSKNKNIEITSHLAYNAMTFFAKNRFLRVWEGGGAEDCYGRLVPCEHEIFKDLKNPKECFEPDLLTPRQWHHLVEISPNMINHIPDSVIKLPEFWNNYESLFGKGSYPVHPSNIDKLFDEMEILSKMPSELKMDPDTYNKLLDSNPYNILIVPENFRTAGMAEKVISSDINLSEALKTESFTIPFLERLLPTLLPRIEEIRDQAYKTSASSMQIENDYSARKKCVREFLINLSPEQKTPVIQQQIDSIFSQLNKRELAQPLCI